jgi:tRNA nucleotidyltransferase (CCA-adding enzyme)
VSAGAIPPPPDSIPVPEAVRWVVRTLEEAGYETWTVGGAVRDALAGRPSGDWDLATRAPPEEVRRIFRRTVPVGIEHGTVGVLARDGTMYEVTTFRRDVETTGRHAVVAFAETLLEDLERRDFTVNAVAWHPLRKELFDPHRGAEDLRRRVLRTVGDPSERFAEDYLRVLRALRFAGRYELDIDPETWSALKAATPHLGVLSPERVREELWKVLEGDASPARALELYRVSGALREVAPELSAVAGGEEVGTPAWRSTLSVVERISQRRPALRLTALLGDLGAPPIREEDPPLPHDPGPAGSPRRLRGMMRSAALLTRLRHSNATIARISALVGAGPDLPRLDAADSDVRRWLARVGPGRVPDLVRWAAARSRVEDGSGPSPTEVAGAVRRLRGELASGVALDVGSLALSGRDLIRMGLKPGPHFGTILDALLERVLEEPEANVKDRLEPWALELARESEGG